MLDTRYWMLDISRDQASSIQNPVPFVSNLFAILRRMSTRDYFLMINDEVCISEYWVGIAQLWATVFNFSTSWRYRHNMWPPILPYRCHRSWLRSLKSWAVFSRTQPCNRRGCRAFRWPICLSPLFYFAPPSLLIDSYTGWVRRFHPGPCWPRCN